MIKSILTPTRNRPANCERFIKSVYNSTKTRKNVEMLFYVDEDDPAIEAYKSLHWHAQKEYEGFKKIDFAFGNPMSVSKSWNILAERCEGDVLIMGNDDLVYQTDGWDEKLDRELDQYRQDKVYVAWMNDGINGEKHCAFPIVSREWYECLGRFTPGCFNFGYNDTWIFDVGKMLDRCHYIPFIKAEHLHFSTGKSEMDDTYARNRTQEKGNLYAKDKVLFNKTRNIRQNDRDRLRYLIGLGKATKLIPKKIDPEFRKNFTFIDINKLKKEWADTGHKLKENPLPEQTKQYEKLCESIKKNGMTHPIIVAGDMRVLRGNQRVWYCIDNNIQMIGAYVIDEGEMDRYIQETYIHKSKYPL